MSSYRYLAVCGGANLDIGGIPFEPPVARDSNPGRVVVSAGGVGRNIAANIARLDERVFMLTALGIDSAGNNVRGITPGVDFSHALMLPDIATSTYLYLTDETGDMVLAVNDMDIMSTLTPDYFKSRLEVLNGAEAVVLDANLSEASLQYLCEHVTAPLFADPVSTRKAMKLLPLLGRLHTLKPNRMEAEVLTGCSVPEDAVEELLKRGVKQVFLSMGAKGVCCGDASGIHHVPAPEIGVHNTTGAGDAFTGALAVAHLRELPLVEAAQFAMDYVMTKLQTEAML